MTATTTRPAARPEPESLATDRPRRAAREPWQAPRAASFLLPAVGLVVIVLLVPMAVTVYRSFQSDALHPSFTGLGNYTGIFTDPALRRSLANTGMWVVGSLILPVGLGLAIAVMTSAMRLGNVARLAVVLPYAMSGTTVAVVGGFVLRSDGALNQALGAVGLDGLQHPWLLSWPTNTIAAILVSTWQSTGVAVVLFLVGLQTIPVETLEAAALDGAVGRRRFVWVVLPQLRAVTVVVVGITLANALKAFDIIFVLTGGGGPARQSETLAMSMYRETFVLDHLGTGAATAVLLTLIVLAASYVYLRPQLRSSK